MAEREEQRNPRPPGESSRAGAQGRTEDAGTADVRQPAEDQPTPGADRPRTGGSGLANQVDTPATSGKS